MPRWRQSRVHRRPVGLTDSIQPTTIMVNVTIPLIYVLALFTTVSGCAVPPTPIPQVDSGSEVTGTTAGSVGASSMSTSAPMDSTMSASSFGATMSTDSWSSTDDPTPTEGSTGSSNSESSEDTAGPTCPGTLVECGGECIDPLSNPAHCGALDPCDVNPGDTCDPLTQLCIDGACQGCALEYNFEIVGPVGSLAGWSLQPDWESRNGTPPSTNPPVSFNPNYVLGTDGNRQSPYPGLENESSQVTTGLISFGDSLSFRSWHVDEGGDNPNGWDNKIIEIYTGAWETLVNCDDGINTQSFCQQVLGPRSAEDWDLIVLDTTMYSGVDATLRITYETNKLGADFEQGWYIDDIRIGDDCGPPT